MKFQETKEEDYKYIDIAFKEALKAKKINEVPVGACLVLDGEIISKGYNTREKNKNTLKHAEINVINKACLKRKEKFLDNATIYITLEPCLMCLGAILQARIKRIVYCASEPKFGAIESVCQILDDYKFNHTILVTKGIKEEEVKTLMKEFFKNLRKK